MNTMKTGSMEWWQHLYPQSVEFLKAMELKYKMNKAGDSYWYHPDAVSIGIGMILLAEKHSITLFDIGEDVDTGFPLTVSDVELMTAIQKKYPDKDSVRRILQTEHLIKSERIKPIPTQIKPAKRVRITKSESKLIQEEVQSTIELYCERTGIYGVRIGGTVLMDGEFRITLLFNRYKAEE
jgi:hypothetical protein